MLDKKQRNRVRHKFLLETFFADSHSYEEKQVGDYWLIREKNGDNGEWQVAIYTKESFNKKLF